MSSDPHLRGTPLRRLPASLAFSLCAALSLAPAPDSFAQDAPLDAAEISRDLLYLVPSHSETRTAGDVIATAYVGAQFEYMPSTVQTWLIRPTMSNSARQPAGKHEVIEVDAFELVGASDDDRATLTLRKKGTRDAISTVTLWDRDQLVEAWLPEMRKRKPGTTADGLRRDLEVADPEMRATTKLVSLDKTEPGSKVMATMDGSILAAVGQSTGEQELGLATIVKFDPKTGQATVYHPAGMLTCEVSTISASTRLQDATPTLWFGTRRLNEGAIAPCGGLSRLDPQTRATTPAGGTRNPPIGSIVTMMESVFGTFDVVTDAGVCRLAVRTEDRWNCWRFVPTVTLKDAAAVANRPGDKPYGQLKAGDYEVLWANQNYLEVATPDSFDAWLAADDFAEAAARHFDVEPYKLLNTASDGPGPLRPVATPGGEPLSGALVYRAPLEKLPAPAGTPADWVKVRARTGWIAREKLEVVPKLVPAKD